MNAPLRSDPAVGRRAMRHVEGVALVEFAEIYDESVELVSVSRPVSDTVDTASQTLLRDAGLQAQWIQGGTGATGAPIGGRSHDCADALQALHDAMEAPVEVLRELLECESCGVRVKVLDGPMCPRFHVDQVPARMLITYAGPGTDWISHNDIDLRAMASREPEPLRPGCTVRSLATGAWSLLKGGRWDSDYCGVLHRSPAGSGLRLLVSLDPIFSS
ncbi:MAG: DUF1826 domain-containing protein [Pseudomonadota bacterium]